MLRSALAPLAVVGLSLAISGLNPAAAAPIKIKGATASSTYPITDGLSYEPKKAHDGKSASSWVEGDEGSGLGSWIELDLGGEKTVTRVKIWGGDWSSYEYHQRANRPKDVELKFSDGSTQDFTLNSDMQADELVLKKPLKTSTVRVKIKSVHNGSTWFDTVVSEIQVFDDGPVEAKVTGHSSSSDLAPDGDGSYEPKNMTDGLSDTMWCEGDKDGDGNGEWVKFDFGKPTAVSKLSVINGIGSAMGIYMKGNRPKAATLEFSDGSTETIALKPMMFLSQDVSFPSHTTTSVKLTVTEVQAGKEFNDLCISEASFSE